MLQLRQKNRNITSHYCGAIIPAVRVFDKKEELCLAVCRSYPNVDLNPDYYEVKFVGGTNQDSFREKNETLSDTFTREATEEGDITISSAKRIWWKVAKPKPGKTGDHFKCFSIVSKYEGLIAETFEKIGGVKEISGEYVTRPVLRPIIELFTGIPSSYSPKDRLFYSHVPAGIWALWHLALRNPPVYRQYEQILFRNWSMISNVLHCGMAEAYERFKVVERKKEEKE